jgi:predicted transglutaminase-like cysteine proteinase
MRWRYALGLVTMAFVSQPDMALAKQPVRQFVPLGDSADAPRGFVDMCARDTALCLLGQSSTPAPAPSVIATSTSSAPVATGQQPVTAAAQPLQEPTAAISMAAVAIIPFAPTQVDAAAQPVASVPTVAPVSAAAPVAPPAPPVIAMSDAQLMELIKHVNSQVNREFAQMSDDRTVGTGEYWERLSSNPMRAGDCEDFAIEKRYRLALAGVAPERMFYGVLFVRGQGLHTVLIVRLGSGDYVLDSIAPRVEPWQKTHYTWLRFQIPGQPLTWVRPSDTPAGTTATGI